MDYSAARQLADAIKESEEYRTYHSLKEDVMGEETQAALIREYRKMQTEIQMRAVTGQGTPPEELQRFSTLGSLLYSKPEVSEFLLSEMRLQQTLGEILRIITDAVGLEIQLPG